MILRPYVDREGRNPFELWFLSLEPTIRARVAFYLERLEQGNLSNIKSQHRDIATAQKMWIEYKATKKEE